MIETDEDLAALFDPADWADEALYRPATGPDIEVTVILSQPSIVADLGSVGVRSLKVSALVRAAQVARPRNGDALSVGGKTYVVRDTERDASGQLWRLDLGES